MGLFDIFSSKKKIPALTEKQRWALGVSAIFAEIREQDHVSLSGYSQMRDKKAKEIVRDTFESGWGVFDRDSFFRAANSLFNEGHRSEFMQQKRIAFEATETELKQYFAVLERIKSIAEPLKNQEDISPQFVIAAEFLMFLDLFYKNPILSSFWKEKMAGKDESTFNFSPEEDEMAAFLYDRAYELMMDDTASDLMWVVKTIKKHTALFQNETFLSWDYVRFSLLVRWGVVLKYVSDQEAWDMLNRSAIAMQKTYGSWDEMGMSYINCRMVWNNADVDDNAFLDGEHFRKAFQKLKADPASIFNTVPYDLNLE